MSSFCTAIATHIFFSKKFQHICTSLDVNFNESLTNDIVSFEQLGPAFLLASVAQSDVCPTCDQEVAGSTPAGTATFLLMIGHEIFSLVILSRPLTQEGYLLVSGERMCIIVFNCLGKLTVYLTVHWADWALKLQHKLYSIYGYHILNWACTSAF